MTLYELTEQLQKLYEIAEDPDTDPEIIADTMEAVEGDFETKADGYAMVIKQLNADAKAVKEEIDRLTARKKALENSAERITNNLQAAMIAASKPKFKTTLFSFGIQKNPASVVMDTTDVFKIPQAFITIPDPVINKSAIKDALKAGENLEGIAHLEQGEKLRIR